MLIALALASAPLSSPLADPAVVKLAQLYEDVCLTAFPDDEVATTVLTSRRAIPLPATEARGVLRDATGRAWTIGDGDGRSVVTIVTAPNHACAVQRRIAGPFVDRTAYREVIARFKSIGPSFQPMTSRDATNGATRSHVESETRVTNLGAETLLLATETRPDGGADVRFVRSIRK